MTDIRENRAEVEAKQDNEKYVWKLVLYIRVQGDFIPSFILSFKARIDEIIPKAQPWTQQTQIPDLYQNQSIPNPKRILCRRTIHRRTFTNTRSNNTSPISAVSAPALVQKSHKRNAHSISSAQLARPPTSPGLSPRPPDFVRALGTGIGEGGRKGLIGAVDGKGKGKEVLEASRSALEKAKRSASVDISASEENRVPLPVFEVQPAMLAVDLGKSRGSKYSRQKRGETPNAREWTRSPSDGQSDYIDMIAQAIDNTTAQQLAQVPFLRLYIEVGGYTDPS
ncbi:hypothetical protein DFJ58DRAFT_914464 [Suillus subalutaceus]|uniref:uncharacterized protein n=1 Tax=Suillus subalutaceus TaxID=48586 RepID=UPI001B85E3C5|nr:uncharacterized protein DFJ58DRAFT_914464 [Suillus subalutaceus]KAG1851850.1 hypothetical protein DFJ58DRAFT_914464 [Suillus subalutaceus]